jgi:hypothetical protein
MPWPDNGRAGSPRSRRPGSGQYYTATTRHHLNGGVAILPDAGDRHCERCRCRCGCHRPPPEPPYTPWPSSPQPGEPFYMAAVALGEVEVEEWAA